MRLIAATRRRGRREVERYMELVRAADDDLSNLPPPLARDTWSPSEADMAALDAADSAKEAAVADAPAAT